MNKQGPIVVIEDDVDDQDILQEIFKRLAFKNEILFFTDGKKAFEYLNQPDSKPFIILSDVNLPKMDGFELRNKMFTDQEFQARCIPYLFFTTGTHKKAVMDAYALSVQGFFIKPSNLTALENTLRKIIDYWQECISPCYYD
ncbi:MAG: response regulator [Bacteroidota bacterium]